MVLLGTYTLDDDISSGLQQKAGMLYRLKFVELMEKQGWKLKSQVGVIKGRLQFEPGRVRYTLWADFARKPSTLKIEDVSNEIAQRIVEAYGGTTECS